jgi:phosphoglycerol transferase
MEASSSVAFWSSAPNRMRAGALLVAAITAGLLTVLYELWRVPLRVPLVYWGDANAALMFVKGLSNGHWYYTNDRLGFPFGLEMYDFPTSDHFQILIYKTIGALVGGDPALTVNLGYLFGFIAIAVTAYLVLCALGIRPVIAGAFGILYAFLPYHFARGTGHLFLSGYFAVPLAILVILRQYDRPAFLTPRPSNPDITQWSWRDRWGWLALVILIIVGTTGFYYAVFTGLFLVATLVFRLIGERDRTATLSTLFLCTVLGLTLLAGLAPTFIYQATHGANDIAVNRLYQDVEFYALRPLQMLLPAHDHRLTPLRAPMAKALTPGQEFQSLGLVAAIGLVMVVLRTLARIGVSTPKEPHSRILDTLGMLTIGAIIGASVGGFAAGFGLMGLTHIRAWNRISIFVGFFVLASVALVIDGWARRNQFGLGLVAAVSALLVVIGVLDQTPAPTPDVDKMRVSAWDNDQDFFKAVESEIGPNAAIYQLPSVAFPEVVNPNAMTDYDHLRGYLHTDSLQWSYGAVKGRVPEWQLRIDAQDTASKLKAITTMGFDGIYIDRWGYADNGAAVEFEIRGATGLEPMVSQDDRLVFFNLEPIADTLSGIPDETRSAIAQTLTDPIQATYADGFQGVESDGLHSWSWASPQAKLNLLNPTQDTRHVVITMGLETGFKAPSNVTLRLPGFRRDAVVSAEGGCIRMEFDLPPGFTTMSLETDAARIDAPGDPRDLRLRVLDMTIGDTSTERLWDLVDAPSC